MISIFRLCSSCFANGRGLVQSLQNASAMRGATRPISLRLAPRHIEQLKARAFTVSGTLTGVARQLILTGLAGGDNKALAERLMHIERRLTALECLAREVNEAARRIDCVSCDLRSKFDALLQALSSAEGVA
jgi:hypothetical protein